MTTTLALRILGAGAVVAALAAAPAGGAPRPAVGDGPVARAAYAGTIYFTGGEQFAPVRRALPDSGRRLPTALKTLLAGPTAAEERQGLGSAIPSGTKVLAESFDARTGLASIRFNARFIFTRNAVHTREEAIREYYGRAGEVVFTATSLPEVKAVRLSVPGRAPVTLRRADFAKPAGGPPAEKVPAPKSPAPGDTLAIQQALVRLTYLPPEAATGTFDDRTKQAIIAFQSWNGLGRDGVAGVKTTAALVAGTAPTPRATGTGRWVEIHRSAGVVLLVDNGVVRRAIHTSTGRGGSSTDLGTPPGTFKIYRKEQKSWSVPYRVWLPYAAYWDRGWALHGYHDVPTYPASAGCARLPLTEAPVVYAFVALGTVVHVY